MPADKRARGTRRLFQLLLTPVVVVIIEIALYADVTGTDDATTAAAAVADARRSTPTRIRLVRETEAFSDVIQINDARGSVQRSSAH